MKKYFWILAALLFLTACGDDPSQPEMSDAATQSSTSDREDDDAQDGGSEQDFDKDSDVDPELGALTINLAGDQQTVEGYCELAMTRMQGNTIATVSAILTVQTGADDDFGELNLNWGIDPDTGMNPMGISYGPTADTDADAKATGWVQDNMNTESASLAIVVDGEPYNFATGDLRGTDNPSGAPHLWPTALTVSANLVQPLDNGQSSRARGRFQYNGLCTVSIKVLP